MNIFHYLRLITPLDKANSMQTDGKDNKRLRIDQKHRKFVQGFKKREKTTMLYCIKLMLGEKKSKTKKKRQRIRVNYIHRKDDQF